MTLPKYAWNTWRPDREPTDNELLAMTDEEFLSYAEAMEQYARNRVKEDFVWHSRPCLPAETAETQ
jgi:hypothetical protein